MAREVIDVGTIANDGTGDTLRACWIKVNTMTSELYTALGDGSTLNTNEFTTAEKDKLASLNKFMPIEEESATSYAAVADDAGKYKRMTAAAAVTFTISDGIFSAGDEIIVEQAGTGTVTFAAGGSMTINSRGGANETVNQYSFASLKFISDSVVILGGDIQ